MPSQVDNVADAFASGKPRRLKWTCRFCESHFQTWTRRGMWLTCPHCGRGQEGPAGIQRLLDRARTPAQKAAITKATTLKVVADSPPRKAPAVKRTPGVKQPAAIKPAVQVAPTPPPPP